MHGDTAEEKLRQDLEGPLMHLSLRRTTAREGVEEHLLAEFIRKAEKEDVDIEDLQAGAALKTLLANMRGTYNKRVTVLTD